MQSVAKKMDFDVYTNLKTKDKQYNIKIDLENEVDANTRELAINVVGTIVRNNYASLYGRILEGEQLVETIKSELDRRMPKHTGFKAMNVSANMKLATKRSA